MRFSHTIRVDVFVSILVATIMISLQSRPLSCKLQFYRRDAHSINHHHTPFRIPIDATLNVEMKMEIITFCERIETSAFYFTFSPHYGWRNIIIMLHVVPRKMFIKYAGFSSLFCIERSFFCYFLVAHSLSIALIFILGLFDYSIPFLFHFALFAWWSIVIVQCIATKIISVLLSWTPTFLFFFFGFVFRFVFLYFHFKTTNFKLQP